MLQPGDLAVVVRVQALFAIVGCEHGCKGGGTMATAEALSALAVPEPGRAQASVRLASIDNLRILLASLVVAHHAGQPYGPPGDDWALSDAGQVPLLGPFFAVNLAIGMGLFFLIAGYFVPGSLKRKGAGGFLRDRTLRLGVPLLLVSLLLVLNAYLSEGRGQPFGAFLAGYLGQSQAGHMWFVGHLLIFCWGYAGWRWLASKLSLRTARARAAPGHGAIIGYTLGLAAATFVIRIWFPLNEWVSVAPLLQVEWAHIPQHLSLFIVGIVAKQHDWFNQLSARVGRRWLAVGLAAAALPYADMLLQGPTATDTTLLVRGGLSLAAFRWSLIEACICVGLSIGVITWFRERAHGRSALLQELAAASYGVYVLHILPVLGLQLMLAPVALPPLGKFAIVTLVAVPLSFLMVRWLRHLDWVRHVI
jgi:glucan biosynthesis protein C